MLVWMANGWRTLKRCNRLQSNCMASSPQNCENCQVVTSRLGHVLLTEHHEHNVYDMLTATKLRTAVSKRTANDVMKCVEKSESRMLNETPLFLTHGRQGAVSLVVFPG